MGKIPYYLFGQEPTEGSRNEIEIKLGHLDDDQTLDTLSFIFVNDDANPPAQCECEEGDAYDEEEKKEKEGGRN